MNQDELLAEIERIALENDDFRRRLAEKVREISAGLPRRKPDVAEIQLVADAANRRQRNGCLPVAELFAAIGSELGLAQNAVSRRYYQAAKRGMIERMARKVV
jgi:hypothetical protein